MPIVVFFVKYAQTRTVPRSK